MDTPPIPASPSGLPGRPHDEPPLLTETVDTPSIPLLSEAVDAVPLLAEPVPASPVAEPPSAPVASSPAPSRTAEPMAQIERELHAAAQLIMQEVIDDYMLQIEAELHRRLEEHLAGLLRAGRR